MKADVGVEVAFTDVGGWDHHAAEGGVQGQLAARLREFGEALAAFRSRPRRPHAGRGRS